MIYQLINDYKSDNRKPTYFLVVELVVESLVGLFICLSLVSSSLSLSPSVQSVESDSLMFSYFSNLSKRKLRSFVT